MDLPRIIRPIGWLGLLLPLLFGAATGLRHLERVASVPAAGDEPVYLPKAEYLAPMALGWRNVLADVLWFRTISYFGRHYRSDRTYPWLAAMCDLVTDLDPRAEHVYRFAGAILPWEADEVDAGIRLLEKGVRQFPDSWVMHYQLGFSEYFFRDNVDTAVAQLTAAAKLPGAHPTIARLAAILARQQLGPATTLSFLEEMQNNVESADVRAVIGEQIREARFALDLERLQAAADAYRARFGRPARSLGELVDAGLIAQIPGEPFGGTYQIDGEGKVRSTSGHEPSRVHTSKNRERALLGEPIRDP
jgi:hypothetical protein